MMSKNLPIKTIFSESISLAINRRSEILRIGWPYLLLLLIASFFSVQIQGGAELIVFYILITSTSVLAIVGCHRIFLLTDEQASETATIRWTGRETRFLINSVGLGFIAALSGAPILLVLFNVGIFEQVLASEGFGSEFLSVFVTLPSIYLICRLSLIFPDIAVDSDRDRSLAWAWGLSSGHSARLFLLVGVVPLTAWGVLELITVVLGESLIIIATEVIVYVGISVIEVCLLSLSYKWLVSNSNQQRNTS